VNEQRTFPLGFILFFAGDQDFVCNYMGIENMIKAMTWNGATGLGVSYFFRRLLFCAGERESDIDLD